MTCYGPQILMTTVAQEMRNMAMTGTFDGTEECFDYLARCESVHSHISGIGTRLMFARDVGYMESGIFEHVELDRAYRLSVGFFHSLNGEFGGFDFSHLVNWIQAFFMGHVAKTWIEPPARLSRTRVPDMWHIRLFCDSSWIPISIEGDAAAGLLMRRWYDYKTFLNSQPTPERAKTPLRIL